MPLAAKNDQSQLRIEDRQEPRIFPLVDGHITALLEQAMDGNAVLMISPPSVEACLIKRRLTRWGADVERGRRL